MARSARRAGRQPAAECERRARVGVAAALLGAAMLVVGLPLAGVAGAAETPDVTNSVPIASASGWAPLVTLALVTAVVSGIVFWRARRATRARRP